MAGTDPQAGDPVILRGRIKSLIDGVALVEVYRTFPVGGTVAVQCGALELDETQDDGAAPASDEDRIRDAMAEAAEHPRPCRHQVAMPAELSVRADYDGALLKISAVNRTVIYSITEYIPAVYAYIAEWPD
jgi:hypothetical protein